MVFDQEANLVKFLFAPAEVTNEVELKCKQIATRLIKELKISGLLAVEFFLTKQGKILINEVAPRPHNSGHHTLDASICSQFENHIRGVIGFPLGETGMYKNGAMINVLGEDGFTGPAKYLGLEDVLSLSDVHVHLYGKSITKPKRKMGHINVLGNSKSEIEEKIDRINKFFKVIT
jgi:5-(carboxyamino)imidazole ribonucleotide synthase